MANEVTLTMDGMLLNWLKDVGDNVSSGDIIAEFEADKATIEVEAGADGVILELRGDAGDEYSEGDIIAVVGAEGESAGSSSSGNGASAEAKAEAKPVESDTPKATPSSQANGNSASVTANGRVKASPLARNIAEEKGIDLSQVNGTGPGGRITKRDVENFTPDKAKAPAKSKESASAGGASVSTQTWDKVPTEDVEIIEITRMRKAIAANTILSNNGIPHFFVTMDMDVEPLLALRKELNAELESEGIKISVNDMVIKATALALKQFPNLNTHYYGDKLVRHQRINIGVSVALPDNGLMNVVCHDADKIALSVMAENNKAMYARAREGKIHPQDIKGATFTVSNLGPYNVESFSAIINPPEAGIIAVASAKQIPIVNDDGSLGVGSRMKATLSVDHRVSDGAEGAEYMQLFRSLIENPMRLLV